MVLVFRFTATAVPPTGMVAVTVQPLAVWAVPRAEDAGAAAAVTGAASASEVMATAVSFAPRCVNLIMSVPLACQGRHAAASPGPVGQCSDYAWLPAPSMR